ncbi:MAG: HNH endonuclease family protein [Actinomycetaceae bacterium]|nr:HNH endonuclease family protein [Actinomycetaceae bacterium]
MKDAIEKLLLIAGCMAFFLVFSPFALDTLKLRVPALNCRGVVLGQGSLGQLCALRLRSDDLESRSYRRENFGQAWADTDHNGCDTRSDILRRDFLISEDGYDVAPVPSTRAEPTTLTPSACALPQGTIPDPYTLQDMTLDGTSSSSTIHIDHIVPLSAAWRHGAHAWSKEQRLIFANDPLNLLAVSNTANTEKGKQEADEWLPANEGYRCEYISRQIAVKYAWDLSVSAAEKRAMLEVLSTCHGSSLR